VADVRVTRLGARAFQQVSLAFARVILWFGIGMTARWYGRDVDLLSSSFVTRHRGILPVIVP